MLHHGHSPVAICSRPLYLVPQRSLALAPHVPVGRTLHLLDPENLMGGPHQSCDALRYAAQSYKNIIPVRSGDHVIVGTSPGLALEAGLKWPGSRLVIGSGPDGADHALLDAVEDTEWVAERFDRVIIGSGDGIFQPLAHAFRSRGVAVGVVGREGTVARGLAEAADLLCFITGMPQIEVVA